MAYLLKRSKCNNPDCMGNNEGFIRLVNNEYCIKCYQAIYYKTNTKKKRKKKQKNNLYKSAWWIEAYSKL